MKRRSKSCKNFHASILRKSTLNETDRSPSFHIKTTKRKKKNRPKSFSILKKKVQFNDNVSEYLIPKKAKNRKRKQQRCNVFYNTMNKERNLLKADRIFGYNTYAPRLRKCNNNINKRESLSNSGKTWKRRGKKVFPLKKFSETKGAESIRSQFRLMRKKAANRTNHFFWKYPKERKREMKKTGDYYKKVMKSKTSMLYMKRKRRVQSEVESMDFKDMFNKNKSLDVERDKITNELKKIKSSGVKNNIFSLLVKRLKMNDRKILKLILKKIEKDEKGQDGFRLWKKIMAYINEVNEVENIEVWENINRGKRRHFKTSEV